MSLFNIKSAIIPAQADIYSEVYDNVKMDSGFRRNDKAGLPPLSYTDSEKRRQDTVIPAQAGIHFPINRNAYKWVSAFAGVTSKFFLLPIIFIGLITLSACGFQPLYVTSAPAGEVLPFGQIEIANIPDRNGQYLRNQLIDAIYIKGYPDFPQYRLVIQNLTEAITQLGIRKDETATRAQTHMRAVLLLVDKNSGETLLKRSLVATNSFNILDSQYTTNVSTQYARERSLDEIARQVTTQLALYFQRQPDAPPESMK